jgi:hypothetical protein
MVVHCGENRGDDFGEPMALECVLDRYFYQPVKADLHATVFSKWKVRYVFCSMTIFRKSS